VVKDESWHSSLGMKTYERIARRVEIIQALMEKLQTSGP